jgi:lysophospholipase L1-like esterase
VTIAQSASRAAARVLPGIAQVRAQTAPFAQAWQAANAEAPLRVVNLSVTGARIRDVLDRQAAALADLGDDVALVTVLAGANDMYPRARRAYAPRAMAELLDVLPPRRTVVATMPRRNQAALAVNAVLDDAARRGVIALADLRGITVRSLVGTLAADMFHLNERGYAALADTFDHAIPTRLHGR